MTITPTALLSLPILTTGTESGTWGDVVDNGLTPYLDIAIAGGLAITITTADVTLTKTAGTSSATNIGSTSAQYAILNVSGAMTAARNLIVPSTSKWYIINNATTGGFALTVKGATTMGVSLVNGETALIAWNGTDFVKIRPTAETTPYIPAGTGAIETTVQNKLRQTVSVMDRGAVADWNGSTGTDNSSAFVAAITYAATNRKRLVIPAGRYSVGVSGIVYTASAINYLEIYFEAGVELVCTYSGASYPFLLNLNGVGAGVKIIGNGAQLTYANTPSTRGTNHAVYLFGAAATITDLWVHGLVINNSANMGIAVFAGPMGGTSSGNKNIWIVDCVTKATKGDGIHVENFDSGVHIVNSRVEAPGDDTICISNYNGVSGAPTKTTATTDVEIENVHAINAYSAVVRLLGVQRCSINKIRGTLLNTFGGSGASVVSCDETTGDYAADNIDIVATDIEVTGGAGLFYWSAGGMVSNFKMSKATQKQGNNYGIRALASSSVGTKLNNISFDDIHIERATNSGTAGNVPIWATYVRSLTLRNIKVVNAPSVLILGNSDRVVLDDLQADSSGSVGSAFSITNNTNIKVGRLTIDASCTFTTGATFTSNTNVHHTAIWDFSGATNKLGRSGNTGVRGFCQRVEGSVFLGSITGGTNAKQTYAENIITGASYQLQATLISDQGTRWGVTGMAADGFFVLYTDTMTNARINYVAETNVGY